MKTNIYETTIHICCPFQPIWDYYVVRFESSAFMQCEKIEECCDSVRGITESQESVADLLYKSAVTAFGGVLFQLTVEGRHGANCKTTVKR